MSAITSVSFLVPSEHALEFQRRAFALLAELTGTPTVAAASDGFTPLSSKNVRGVDVWALSPWTDDDHDRAAWLAADLPDSPRAVLSYLCDNADIWITGTDIGDQLGLKYRAKSVPPSFKSMANRCRRVERRPLWDYDNQHGYRVSALVARLFDPVLQAPAR